MAVTRNSFSALMYKGLNIIVQKGLADTPQQFSQFFNMKNSDRAFETEQQIATFGYIPQKFEGTEAAYDDPIQSYEKLFFNLTYALKYRITQEAYEDDQYEMLGQKMANNFYKSARATQEVLAASLFNNGFTIDSTNPDGVAYFTPSHPLAGGGSYGNAPTTASALSQTSIQSAINTMRGTPDDRGLLGMGFRPVALVVPRALQFTAQQIIRSAQVLVGTDQNPINPIKDSLTVYTWDYLTSSTAWFLICAKDETGATWYDRKKPSLRDYTDNQTEDAVYGLRFRCSSGQSFWRGAWGNSGA